MPTPILIISFAFLGLAALLSARLVRSAWRSRGAPDVLVALFFVGGVAGYAALLVRRALPELSPSPYGGLAQLGNAGLLLPCLCIVLFTWRVFRPGERWACCAALGLSLTTVGAHAMVHWLAPLLGAPAAAPSAGVTYWIGTVARAFGFGWACSESLLYWSRARRRVVLGLADPLVCNRFLLWALWSGAAGAILVIRVVASTWLGADDVQRGLPTAIAIGQLVAALLCATSICLTFAPPRFYREWVSAPA